MIRKLLISFAFVTPLGALAQDVDCNNAMTQMDINFCAAQSYYAADAELNEVYQKARAAAKAMSPAIADKILEAQRAWIPYRDAACETEGLLFEGGSIQPMIVVTCLEKLTRQRTDDLRAIYE